MAREARKAEKHTGSEIKFSECQFPTKVDKERKEEKETNLHGRA